VSTAGIFAIVAVLAFSAWWIIARHLELGQLLQHGVLAEAEIVGCSAQPEGDFWIVSLQYTPAGSNTPLVVHDYLRALPQEPRPVIGATADIHYDRAQPKRARLTRSSM
jgi:hypothetical protein